MVGKILSLSAPSHALGVVGKEGLWRTTLAVVRALRHAHAPNFAALCLFINRLVEKQETRSDKSQEPIEGAGIHHTCRSRLQKHRSNTCSEAQERRPPPNRLLLQQYGRCSGGRAVVVLSRNKANDKANHKPRDKPNHKPEARGRVSQREEQSLHARARAREWQVSGEEERGYQQASRHID